MTRVKRGTVTKKRHKRVLKSAKGFWGQRKNIFKRAKETLMRAWAFAFVGRKLKKRDMRSLFVSRVAAAAKQHGTNYSNLIGGLKRVSVQLNRKMLSQIAVHDAAVFARIASLATAR